MTDPRSTCPNCGAAGVYTGKEKVCAHCNFEFTTGSRAGSAAEADATKKAKARPRELLRGALDRCEVAPAPAHSLRSAAAAYGRALEGAGRAAQALAAYDQALQEKGRSPSAADLHIRRARCLLAIHGSDLVDVIRSMLAVAAQRADDAAAILLAVTTALTEETAKRLLDFLNNEWMPDLDTTPSVHAQAHVLLAACLILQAKYVDAGAHLERAAGFDQQAARADWATWVEKAMRDGTVLAALPGGLAQAVTLQARAHFALGDLGRARRLVDQVIEEGMTGPGYPEWDAYQLRAALPGRESTERAADLVDAATRLSWRGSWDDLTRAVELLDRAEGLDAANVQAIWTRVAAKRVMALVVGKQGEDQSGETSTPDADTLRDALADWDRGVQTGMEPTAWAWLIRAQVCESLSEVAPDAMAWRYQTLAAAAQAIRANPQWSYAWATGAIAARNVFLWASAAWSTRHLMGMLGEMAVEDAYQWGIVLRVLLLLDPDDVRTRLDEYEALFPEEAKEFAIIRAILAVSTGLSTGSDMEFIYSQVADLKDDLGIPVWVAQMLALSGDRRGIDMSRIILDRLSDDPSPGPKKGIDSALLALRAGDLDQADREFDHAGEVRQQRGPAPIDYATFELHRALARGDREQANRSFKDMLSLSTVMDARLMRLELRLVADRLEMGDISYPADRAGEMSCLARELADRVDDAMPDLAAMVDADLNTALLEIDRHALGLGCWAAAPELLADWRALLSEQIRKPVDQAEDLIGPPRLLLGDDLVPSDAGSQWPQWVLFTEIIPRVRSLVANSLGFNCPGIKVRPEFSLAPMGYRFEIADVVMAEGICHHDLPRPVGVVADYPPGPVWDELAEVMISALKAEPVKVFWPGVMSDYVDAWHEHGGPAADRADLIENSLNDRVALWRRLRQIVEYLGRVPEPQSLADMLGDGR